MGISFSSSFYCARGVNIKPPSYNFKDEKEKNAIKPLFCCTGIFRGQEFTATGMSTKQDAKTEAARLIVQRLRENNEICPYAEDQEVLSRAKEFKINIRNRESEIQREFDQCFANDPYRYAVEW